MMIECESMANSYTKYIHSVDSLNARYGTRIRKDLSPHRKWTIICFDLELGLFNFKLLSVAQSDMC